MMFDFRKRIKNLRIELKKNSINALLVTSEANVTYLSAFTGSDSVLLITPDAQFFLTDSRYTEDAKDTLTGFIVTEVTSSTYHTIGEILKKNKIKNIAFESMNLPYEVVKRLEGYVGKTKLISAKNLVENLRVIKDAEEIRCIKRSIQMTKEVLKDVIKEVRPGVSEKRLSSLIECEFIKKGARTGFQTIVAHGKNCSRPHAHPTDEKIAGNDTVMIDIGCRLDSYNSDMTRMVLIGRVKDKIKEIYAIVKTAQEKAFENIRPGRKISDIDLAGRQYIQDKGFGRFFGHSIGHGVGLEVHEEPSISRKNNQILRPGMVFTVEPAIYIPKFGGVRIEDMVLVTERGCKILTR